jgi:hypothetical protein
MAVRDRWADDRAVRNALRLVLVLSTAAVGCAFGGAAAHAQRGLPTRLEAGQRWSLPTTVAQSPSGEFQFVTFRDGQMELDQIVHLPHSPTGAITEAMTWGVSGGNINRNCQHGYLTMQTDGNLVEYCRPGDPIWSTHTRGTGQHNYFQIQDNGNLVVRTATGHRVWSSGSTAAMLATGQHLDSGARLRTKGYGHRFVSLTMQRDGDLVLTYGARMAWHSDTHVARARLAFLRGGNLIVEGPRGKTLWSSHTAGIGAASSLMVLDDGKIAEARITGPHGHTRWSRMG